MPIPFRRRDRISPDFIAVPAEQPVPVEVRIADLDQRLSVIAEVPPAERNEALWWQLDRLLDMRNAIRPARQPRPVPVIPGRVDSIIDNRREPVSADHIIEMSEDVDNDRTYWECSCGNGGSAASWKVDIAAEKHVAEGESVAYRYPARREP
jgi:hypothetical protein